MPRIVATAEKLNAINLMLARNEKGEFVHGQREIERMTGLSRPFLRKLAREIGHQHARNGIEIKGQICMCANCGTLFRRPKSKKERAKNQFCDDLCKFAFMKGPSHPMWKTGKTASTFSTWAKNQAAWGEWQEKVFARDGYKCMISGKTENLQAHHIMQKSLNPEKVFDVENGITLAFEVHQKLHELVRKGLSYEEAMEVLKKEYSQSPSLSV